MARPSETYRAARRNAWRGSGEPWWPHRISGARWQEEFNTIIKDRPHTPRGWPWKQGGRAVLNKVREIWRGAGSPQERAAAIQKMVAEAQRLKLP